MSPLFTPVPAPKPATVLVVEDNVDLRFMLADWLRNKGYIVLEAATGNEAEMLLASVRPIDVVITDLWMPGMLDGFDLLSYIRRIFPQMHVILVSGIYQQKDVEGASFFRKPYDMETVSSHIANLLEGKSNKK